MMTAFPLLRFTGLLALAAMAASQRAGEGDIAAPIALFFYYGYLNEWSAHSGWTTIGGRECRDLPRCTFDQFMAATTTAQGGYRGGQTINESNRNDTSRRLAESLQRRGLTQPIAWDPRRLVIDAPSSKSVMDDHVQYVINAFEADAERPGHEPNFHVHAMDALTMAAEIQGGLISRQLRDDLVAMGAISGNPQFTRLPLEGSNDHSPIRDVIDLINLVKTWGIERIEPNVARARAYNAQERWKYGIGRLMASYRRHWTPCSSYPGNALLPPIRSPGQIIW